MQLNFNITQYNMAEASPVTSHYIPPPDDGTIGKLLIAHPLCVLINLDIITEHPDCPDIKSHSDMALVGRHNITEFQHIPFTDHHYMKLCATTYFQLTLKQFMNANGIEILSGDEFNLMWQRLFTYIKLRRIEPAITIQYCDLYDDDLLAAWQKRDKMNRPICIPSSHVISADGTDHTFYSFPIITKANTGTQMMMMAFRV